MDTKFSAEIYSSYNLDLQGLSVVELERHFSRSSHEARIYGTTNSTADFLSMRWLRGSGIEVGAGANPTSLFGNATTLMGDCDVSLAFGGDRIDLNRSVDSVDFSIGNINKFDFSIASHVLEHADSFLRALENLLLVTKPGGVVYIVLPDINYLNDKNWLPRFDFDHHLREYIDPLAFADTHDQLYISSSRGGIIDNNVHAKLSIEYKEAILMGSIPSDQRFLHHKHNYDFNDWINLLHSAGEFLSSKFKIMDARYGHERMDCHFVLGAV